MDQAVFLLDNQYDPHILDRVYHEIREKTWDHCINIQEAMMRQKVWDGPITDFQRDTRLNLKMGWPSETYHIFIKKPFLTNQQRYVMSFFLKNQNTISLREILQDSHYHFQYTLHLGDYLYMEARICITQKGTYILVIPNGEYGLNDALWQDILNDYGSPYTPNRWTLIQRPKVNYVYGLTTPAAAIQNTNRIYLNTFTEKKSYYVKDLNPDWKVFISDNTENLSMLTGSIAEFKYDETGASYLEISETFAEYIRTSMAQINIFAYHEDRNMGSAMSPNYIGPTGYLLTMFSEYIAAVNSARLKILAQTLEGGWEMIDGTDAAFDNGTDLIAVGYDMSGECWLTIPTKDGVSPVNPQNFRIWEYFSETDTLGRMVATGVSAQFPNIYHYKLESEASILYIEWFRDDETLGAEYEDFLKPYRDYIGNNFTVNLLNGTTPQVVTNFTPVHSVFDETDFIKNVLLYSSHEYRVEKMIEILSETGMHYDILQNAIDAQNVPYTTAIFKLELVPGMYEKLIGMGSTAKLIMGPLMKSKSFDMYIDGRWDADAVYDMDTEGNQCIFFDATGIKPNSIIIIDCYECDEQISGKADVGANFLDSRIWDFPIEYVSGNDLVVAFPDDTRVNPINLDYGVLAKELLVQVPENLVDWEALGITIDDPRIADRIGTDPKGGPFRSVVFRFLIPCHDKYAILKSNEEENLTFFDVDDRRITVQYFGFLVTTEGYNEGLASQVKFSKKVYSSDLCLHITDATIDAEQLQTNLVEDIQENLNRDLATNKPYQRTQQGDAYVGEVNLYNCNVYARSRPVDLGTSLSTTFDSFYGADDPNRLLSFVDGVLQRESSISGIIPNKMGDPFSVKFIDYVTSGEVGQVVYLPFPAERFFFRTDENGKADLSGKGINVLGIHDLLFEDGLRVPNDTITRVTNQIVKGNPNREYDVIRLRRDSNLYGFQDTEDQSFMDKLFQQSPGFKMANHVF